MCASFGIPHDGVQIPNWVLRTSPFGCGPRPRQDHSMPGTLTGVLHQVIKDTPITVLDFETTGLYPGYDRVVEVSVVRVDPGTPPRLVFDTLVNPDRRMAATEIHGIRDRHVVDAPRFEDVADELLCALSDSVVAAHNVYFDLRFLQFELGRLGLFRDVPHVCTMHTRPLLGLKACSLNDACHRRSDWLHSDAQQPVRLHGSRPAVDAVPRCFCRSSHTHIPRPDPDGKAYKFFSSFG